MSDLKRSTDLLYMAMPHRPRELIEWFLCDCALRVFEKEKAAGRGVEGFIAGVIQAKRALMAGVGIVAVYEQQYELAFRYEIGCRKHSGATETHRLVNRLGVKAASENAYNYALKVMDHLKAYARMNDEGPGGSFYFAEDNERISSLGSGRPGGAESQEKRWLVDHMAYLDLVWQTCGERSIWLLYEGKCPIDKKEVT